MEKIRYSEIFYSVQGEGRFVGVPSVFFRVFLAQKFHHSCENYDTTALSSLNVNKKGPTLEQMPPNAFLYSTST